MNIPEGWHSSLEQVEGATVDPETGDVCITFDVAVGETVALEIDNFRPAIHIEKAASVPEAYIGDTVTYTLAVTNEGVGALQNVTVTDPMCNSAPAFQGGDTDGDDQLDETETWTYTCSHVVTAADADPLVNVATATGEDNNGNTVTDDDTATVDVLHPAIDIEKTGPASAFQGDTLTYTLVVTNTGDVEFASDKVVVTDPQCDDQPTLVSKNGDTSPGSLDPGDKWNYTCSHLTTTSESSVTNVATVTGTDRNGRKATDTDQIVTNLQAQPARQPGQRHGAAARPERLREEDVQGDGPRDADRPGDVLPRRQALQAPDGADGRQALDGQDQPARALLRRAPRDGQGAVRGGVRDGRPDAAAELPAVQAADGAAALHRLSRPA